MDKIIETLGRFWIALEETYGAAGPFYAIAGLGMIIAILSLPFLVRKQKDPLERFSFKDEMRDQDTEALRVNVDDGKMGSLSAYLEPGNVEEMSETRKQLRRAGYKAPSAVRMYYLSRAGLGLGMFGFGVVMFLLVPSNPDVIFAMMMAVIFALAGYFFPTYWVKRTIETRRQEIQNAFPDAMDMMLVCVEGGQSLDQAMTRVGQEMQAGATPLADELKIVSEELRAGKERSAVLRDFAERCAVNDISSFVTVLIQSSQFGTSISQALRVYAAEMRDKRLMRAEEKANVLPTKLTLGTMCFTVPPLILILVGPSFIQILRSLGGLAAAG